ncbi:6424_t:CDS:2 [Funneliformis caledonium]|uniref:6424_t:CDS:1 n=1 Tax=Funneliformis caledonium TaxID=1117310 RepID=A0A9N9GFP5_9GLOM|nr:6424_t:CDS:2 [Funneliformis caledonium]
MQKEHQSLKNQEALIIAKDSFRQVEWMAARNNDIRDRFWKKGRSEVTSSDDYKSQEEMEQVSPSPTPSKPVTPIKRTRLEQWEESDDVIEGEETPGEEKDLTSKHPKRRRPHAPLLSLVPSDDDDEDEVENRKDEGNLQEIDHEDEEDAPLPDEATLLFGQAENKWVLPSGKNVGEIFVEKIGNNSEAFKYKKRPTAIEKATLRYGASNIIDLSAHMKGWFTIEDKKFMTKKHEAILRVPDLPEDVNTFISTVEDMVRRREVKKAHGMCLKKIEESDEKSCMYKVGKIYSDFIFKSKNTDNILSCGGHNESTEIDAILKACWYIIEALMEGSQIHSKWGESFCPPSRSDAYSKGRRCDVRFLTRSGKDLGEWEFAARATAAKVIGDRCRSARINQSILNNLLGFNWMDEQIDGVNVPFLQIAGTSGQMLLIDLTQQYYVVFPGGRFELPTNLQQIGRLKGSIQVLKYCMDMYGERDRAIESLQIYYHPFDEIFGVDDVVPTHRKFQHIRKPWWTQKTQLECRANQTLE